LCDIHHAAWFMPRVMPHIMGAQVRVLPDNQMLEESSASGKMVVGAKWASTEPDMAFAMAGAGGAHMDTTDRLPCCVLVSVTEMNYPLPVGFP